MSQSPAVNTQEAICRDTLYRPFFIAAIAIVLTAGAAWGVLLLWKIGSSHSYTGVTVHEVNAHGHAQIMGWVGLFVIGVGYQLFPKLWGVELPWPILSRVVWMTLIPGIALRSAAMMLSNTASASSFQMLGVVLEVSAVALFVSHMSWVWWQSSESLKPYTAFMLSAMVFFVLQSVYGGWHTYQLMHASHRGELLHQISTYQASLRDMQVHGFGVMMVFAVSLRLFPVFFGLPEVPTRRAWIAWGLMLGAVVLEIGLFLAYQWGGHHAIAGMLLLPWLMFPVAALLIALPWRLWRPLPTAHRSGKFIRIGYAWLFVSLAMLLMLPVYQVARGTPFSHAYYGAIRHAITVGFISMMIVGMSIAIVPRLRSISPTHLPALMPTFVLLNLGCLLRVTMQVGTDWYPLCFKLVGISGVLEWVALAFWGVHLVRLMLRGQKQALSLDLA